MRSLALILALALAVGTLAQAHAGGLSTRAHQMLTQVYQTLDDGDWETAVSQLDQAVTALAREPYAVAVAHQLRGHAQSQLEAYPAALADFERALQDDLLPEATRHQLLYGIVQLHLMLEQYPAALVAVERWLAAVAEISPGARVVAASAYLHNDEYRTAATQLQQAIAARPDAPESWYQMLLGAFHELEDREALALWLPKVIERFPTRSPYWLQLAALHMLEERTAAALSVLEAAHRKALLEREQDYMNLIQLHRYHGTPYRGAQVLAAGLDDGSITANGAHYELLSDTWAQAQEPERAILALEQALELEAGGERRLKLARLLIRQEHWGKAYSVLGADPDALEPDRRGEALLLMGTAAFQDGRTAAARAAFSKAKAHETARDSAVHWLAFLDAER